MPHTLRAVQIAEEEQAELSMLCGFDDDLAHQATAVSNRIRGDHASRRGNKALKRLLFLSAFASLKDPACRAYYDRKRSEGKRHNQALVALARRRCDTLYAMLRDGTIYQPRNTAAA